MKQNLDRKYNRSALRQLLEQGQAPRAVEGEARVAVVGAGLPERGTRGSLYARAAAKAPSSRPVGQNLMGFQTIIDNAYKFSKNDSAKEFGRIKSRVSAQVGHGEPAQGK